MRTRVFDRTRHWRLWWSGASPKWRQFELTKRQGVVKTSPGLVIQWSELNNEYFSYSRISFQLRLARFYRLHSIMKRRPWTRTVKNRWNSFVGSRKNPTLAYSNFSVIAHVPPILNANPNPKPNPNPPHHSIPQPRGPPHRCQILLQYVSSSVGP